MTTKVPIELSSTPSIVDGGNATAITIDSSENVGIGETSSIQGKLHVKSSDSGATADGGANELVVENSSNSGISILSGASASGSIYFGDSGVAYDGYIQYDQSNRKFNFVTAGSGGMTLTSDNKLGLGTSSPATGLSLVGANNTASTLTLTNTAPSPDNAWTFTPQYNSQNLNISGGDTSATLTINTKVQATGGVYISAFDGDKLITDGSQGGGTDPLFIGNAQIQVSSDERIKKDIVDTAINATEKLKQVRVVDFTWNDQKDQSYNNKNARGQWTGAIAQEMISVFPHIINAPRDKETLEVDNDSDRKWMVEYQNLVPVLIKAIQELEARLKTLEDA